MWSKPSSQRATASSFWPSLLLYGLPGSCLGWPGFWPAGGFDASRALLRRYGRDLRVADTLVDNSALVGSQGVNTALRALFSALAAQVVIYALAVFGREFARSTQAIQRQALRVDAGYSGGILWRCYALAVLCLDALKYGATAGVFSFYGGGRAIYRWMDCGVNLPVLRRCVGRFQRVRLPAFVCYLE